MQKHPPAQKLFHLAFVKRFTSPGILAIEKYSIVEWDDVKDAVAEQIDTFVNNGGSLMKSKKTN
jgi:hypothetical protein